MSEREWRFYLDDMTVFAEKVLAYTQGFDQARFEASGLTCDATLRNLELLGEAATHIPAEIRRSDPSIPWRKIIAIRNRLIHAYLPPNQVCSFVRVLPYLGVQNVEYAGLNPTLYLRVIN